jgi:tetratricopeptide (TPR) repeat protein
MGTRLRRAACGIVAGLLACAAVGAVRAAQETENPYPVQGDAPRQEIGGLVSIPGFPLPPVPRDSVEAAIPIYEGLLAGWRLVFGAHHPSVARGIGYLATLYAAKGDAETAERMFEEAQQILERTGTTGRDLGWVHNNRGLARLNRHRLAEAVQSFRAAVAALVPVQGDLREPRAIALQNLASAYHLLGDVEASEEAYLAAIDSLRLLGQEHGRVAQTTRHNLATLYSAMGDHARARPILEDLLERGGLSTTLRFAVLNNLGHCLSVLKEFRAAEGRLREALALTGESSHERVLVLTNLTEVYHGAGDLERAVSEGGKALRLTVRLDGAESRSAAAIEASLGTLALVRGDLAQAENLLTRATSVFAKASGDRLALAGVTQELALVAERQGRRERSLELSRQALDLERQGLDRILAFGSEAQRLSYQSSAFVWDQIANLGDATLVAEAVLAAKGAVLESLLAERALARRSKSPEARQRLDRIHGLKIQLMEATGRGEGSLEALEGALKQEETALAKSLSRSSFPARLRPRLQEVQVALGEDRVLVEMVRFERYEEGGKLVPHYGAVVVAGTGRPVWIPLGPAGTLDASVSALLERLEGEGRGVSVLGGNTAPAADQGEIRATLRVLYDRLWKSLAAAFPPTAREILLSPDGALAFVPWAVLLAEDGTLVAEHWRLAQVGSGRDLVRVASTSTDKTILALADGKDDLPYSRQEVESLARVAQQKGWRPTVLLGARASESELFRRPGPRILHLATHGGTIDDQFAQVIGSRLGKQPMYRGYLLLGGAAKTIDAWHQGSVPPFSEDGILTAEEVGGLDLSRTWLTVLSACRTGIGDARTGEGILGLRRGFVLAGTEHLLFTLWSVDDEATARFMESFYERLFQTGDPARSFQDTQRAELLAWKRGADGLRNAVLRAGGFVLSR